MKAAEITPEFQVDASGSRKVLLPEGQYAYLMQALQKLERIQKKRVIQLSLKDALTEVLAVQRGQQPPLDAREGLADIACAQH